MKETLYVFLYLRLDTWFGTISIYLSKKHVYSGKKNNYFFLNIFILFCLLSKHLKREKERKKKKREKSDKIKFIIYKLYIYIFQTQKNIF